MTRHSPSEHFPATSQEKPNKQPHLTSSVELSAQNMSPEMQQVLHSLKPQLDNPEIQNKLLLDFQEMVEQAQAEQPEKMEHFKKQVQILTNLRNGEINSELAYQMLVSNVHAFTKQELDILQAEIQTWENNK